jgi:aspartate kinase
MLELASVGAKVLQTRSVGLAMRHNLPLRVLSSFEDRPGTLIVGEDRLRDFTMERQVITGIAYDKNEARITLTGIPDQPGTAAAIFSPLAEAGINYDMIVESVPRAGQSADITFTVPRATLAQATDVLAKERERIGYSEILTDASICKVSIVGVGIRSNPELAARMFRTLADRRIDMLAISTSEIKVSVLVHEDYTELAVRVLHTAFGLDAEDEA